MKLCSDQIRNGRMVIANVLVPSLLFLAVCPARSAPQKPKQSVEQFTIRSGTILKAAIELKNSCLVPHIIRVTDNPVYVSFEPASGAALVAPGSPVVVTLVFDATRLAPGKYDFDISTICDDCKSEKRCDVKRSKKRFKITVTGPTSPQAPKQTVVSNPLAALFSEFLETLGRLKLESWAGEKKNARLLESISDSVKRLNEKSHKRSRPPTEQYLQSLRMNLNALKSLVGSTTRSGKRPPVIEIAGFGSAFDPANSAHMENPFARGRINPIFGLTSPRKAVSPGNPSETLDPVAEDMNIKADHSDKSSADSPDLVQVLVVTKKDNKVVNGYEVWCVPLLHETSPELRERFSKLTSPSEKALAAGRYRIGINGQEGPILRIGGDGKPQQTVELPAP